MYEVVQKSIPVMVYEISNYTINIPVDIYNTYFQLENHQLDKEAIEGYMMVYTKTTDLDNIKISNVQMNIGVLYSILTELEALHD